MNATDVIKVLPDICSRHFGYSGWCLLNDAGDRFSSDYEIWGYERVGGATSENKLGTYNSVTGKITWN